MHKMKVLLTAGALVLASSFAWAQKMDTSKSKIGDVPDRIFFEKAAEGGMAEVKLGQLATQKAQSPQVKQFAQRMIDDHSRANDELKQIAEKKQMTMPTAIETKDQALYSKLSKLNGQDFDKQYMQAMAKDHDQVVADFRKEASQGQDEELRQFASKTLPTLEQHDRMAKDIQSGRANQVDTNQDNAQPMHRR